MYGILRKCIWSDLTQKVNLADSHGSNLKWCLMNYQEKSRWIFRGGSKQTESGFYWSRWVDGAKQWAGHDQRHREIRMKSGGQGQGQVCGRQGQVSQGLGQIGSRDQSTVSYFWGSDLAIWALPFFIFMVSLGASPHHLLTLEFCDCQWDRVLKNLSTCTDATLTVTWGKGLPSSWSRSLFLQSHCVDNFKTLGASHGLEYVILRGDAKKAGGRGRCPRKQIFFLSGSPSKFSWHPRLSIEYLWNQKVRRCWDFQGSIPKDP